MTCTFTAALRISDETDDLSTFMRQYKAELIGEIGPPWSRDGKSIWTIDIDVGALIATEEVIEESIKKGITLRKMPQFPMSADVTIWIVVSADKEFVGLALPGGLVTIAAEAKLSFVFSIYFNSDADDSVPDKSTLP